MSSKAERIVWLNAICISCRGRKSPHGLRCKPCSHKAKRKPIAPGGRICPGCGGAKAYESVRCWVCYVASGGPKGRRQLKIRNQLKAISPETLKEAHDLYGSGLSLPEVIDRIWDRTHYASKKNARTCLEMAFRARGWPLRTRSESQLLRYARERGEAEAEQMAVAA